MALYEITPTNMQGSGFFFKGRAGEDMLRCKLVYKHANGAWYLADADLAAETPALGLTMGRANQGQIVRVLKEGYIGRSDWAWTVGGEIYTSATPGELTQVAAGLVQVVGMATRPDMISFDPEGSVGAGGVVCALLEGHTAYVGFDVCKGTNYTNYFTVDGTADDVQIAAAITYALGLGGGTVFLEEGAYDITATIPFAGGDIQIIGDGREATILDLGFDGNLMQIATQDNFTIRDLSMDGNKATYNADVWSGILAQVVDNILVENCDFHDFEGKGVFARAVTDSVFSNCRFYSNDQDGLYLENNGLGILSQRVGVDGCFAYSNGRHGFNAGEIMDVKYVNCFSYSNTEDGYHLEGSADDSYATEKVQLANCMAYSNTQEGFSTLQQVHNISFVNCDSYSNGTGFRLRGDDTFPATDIKIVGCSAYLSQNDGVILAFGMTNILIDDVATYNNDQSETNHDGIAFADEANIADVIITNIQAYDDQVAPTQNRGIDFGVADYDGQNIRVDHITGSGNVNELFRGIGIIVPEFFVPISDSNATLGDHPVVDMPDDTDTNVYAQVNLPLEFQELVTAQVIVVSAASGNMVWTVNTDFGKLCASEDYNTHTDSGGATTAVTINDLECLDISAALSLIAAGDLVGVNFMRDGDNGSDTIEDSVYYLGLRVRYV